MFIYMVKKKILVDQVKGQVQSHGRHCYIGIPGKRVH